MTKAVCIDITGSKRAMDIAFVEEDQIHTATKSSSDEFLNWIEKFQPTAIAVDAPSKRNCGALEKVRAKHEIPSASYGDFRVCEAILRIRGIGLYNTPQERKPAEWVERGWKLYEKLKGLGYELLDQPGVTSPQSNSKIVLEVHPHACFVVGLGWIPQSKDGLAGQIERLAYIQHESREFGIDLSDTGIGDNPLSCLTGLDTSLDRVLTDGIRLPVIRHDELDAVAGVLTALAVLREQAYAVGEPDDGVIVLPRQLADTAYVQKHSS